MTFGALSRCLGECVDRNIEIATSSVSHRIRARVHRVDSKAEHGQHLFRANARVDQQERVQIAKYVRVEAPLALECCPDSSAPAVVLDAVLRAVTAAKQASSMALESPRRGPSIEERREHCSLDSRRRETPQYLQKVGCTTALPGRCAFLHVAEDDRMAASVLQLPSLEFRPQRHCGIWRHAGRQVSMHRNPSATPYPGPWLGRQSGGIVADPPPWRCAAEAGFLPVPGPG